MQLKRKNQAVIIGLLLLAIFGLSIAQDTRAVTLDEDPTIATFEVFPNDDIGRILIGGNITGGYCSTGCQATINISNPTTTKGKVNIDRAGFRQQVLAMDGTPFPATVTIFINGNSNNPTINPGLNTLTISVSPVESTDPFMVFIEVGTIKGTANRELYFYADGAQLVVAG